MKLVSPGKRIPLAALVGCLALTPLVGLAQTSTPDSPVTNRVTPKDDVLNLSPFQVSAGSDEGYVATETLSGSRLRTKLKDVASSVQVMTDEFLRDIAAVNAEQAFTYSINVENLGEYQSSQAGAGDLANGVVNVRSTNRIRGIDNAKITHDFFSTTVPIDTYNTERLSISSGPNAILFGTGVPGGIVDSTYIRANLQRIRAKGDYRIDNYGSHRTTLDVNVPIVKDIAAIRVAALNEHTKSYLKPGEGWGKRYFAAGSVKPFKRTLIRAYYEDAEIDRIIPREVYAGDSVSPWIAAGRPLIDNRAGRATTPTASDPVFQLNQNNRNLWLYGATANGSSYMPWVNATTSRSFMTKGPGDAPYQTGTNAYIYSLDPDSGVSPLDVDVSGNGTRNLINGLVYGAAVEQSITNNLFIEAAYNFEEIENPVADYLRGQQRTIYADANRYLFDGVTLNPNVGRYYVESGARATEFYQKDEEARVMISYDLDLTKHNKWLGRHQIAGLFQSIDSAYIQQEYSARIVPAGANPTTVLNGYGNALYRANIRSYLSDPKDSSTGTSYYFNLPFNPLGPVVLPDGSTLYTVDNPYGGNSSAPTYINSHQQGKTFALQSFFLDGRIATIFGWRQDNSRQARSSLGRKVASQAQSAYLTRHDVAAPTNWTDYNEGHPHSAGIVVHPLTWLSLFYNTSNTWNVPSGVESPAGGVIPPQTGEGKDYGIRLRFFDERVNVRVTKYENTSGPASSNYRNSVIPSVQSIERALYAANPTLAPITYDYNRTTFAYGLTSDLVSEGYEFEIAANPTKQWRIAFNGAKSATSESNIGVPWVDLVKQRIPLWAANLGAIDPNSTGSDTIGKFLSDLLPQLALIRQADGQRTEQGREWRLNFLTNYTFANSFLKGVTVGAGYRYRSAATIGYRAVLVDNEFPYPGAPAQFLAPALDQPITSGALHTVDASVGYSRKLPKGVTWRIALNIRNLLDDDDLIATRANTNGEATILKRQEGRAFVMTNSFTF